MTALARALHGRRADGLMLGTCVIRPAMGETTSTVTPVYTGKCKTQRQRGVYPSNRQHPAVHSVSVSSGRAARRAVGSQPG